MASVDVVTEAVIDRPVHDVASFASDHGNAPRWYENIESAEWETAPPLKVGSRVAFVARFLGRRLSYVYEVTEWKPGDRLVMRTAQGPFPMETTYEWEPVAGDRTRMRLWNRGEPRGFGVLFAPIMRVAMRRENRQDLERLRELLEKGRAS